MRSSTRMLVISSKSQNFNVFLGGGVLIYREELLTLSHFWTLISHAHIYLNIIQKILKVNRLKKLFFAYCMGALKFIFCPQSLFIVNYFFSFFFFSLVIPFQNLRTYITCPKPKNQKAYNYQN